MSVRSDESRTVNCSYQNAKTDATAEAYLKNPGLSQHCLPKAAGMVGFSKALNLDG